MSTAARVGDYVTARFEVVPTTQGSTSLLYPGINVDGKLIKLDKLEIVSVEQDFRVGDWAQDKAGSDYGQITAILDGHAWVKQVGRNRPTTRDLRNISRMDRK